MYPLKCRTLYGLIKLHMILISSLNPGGYTGGYTWGGCTVTPNSLNRAVRAGMEQGE